MAKSTLISFFVMMMLVYAIKSEENVLVDYMIHNFVGGVVTVACSAVAYVPLVGAYTIGYFFAHSKKNPVMNALIPAQVVGTLGWVLFLIRHASLLEFIKEEPDLLGYLTGTAVAVHGLWELQGFLKEKYSAHKIYE